MLTLGRRARPAPGRAGAFCRLAAIRTSPQRALIVDARTLLPKDDKVLKDFMAPPPPAQAPNLTPRPGPMLTDGFGRMHDYLRVSLTERCNLRCVYCMPIDGVQLSPAEKLLQTDEIVRMAKIFDAQGATKLRLTGGEPTIRSDLLEIISRVRSECPGFRSIGMTTNGVVLKPSMLEALCSAGLTHLNISLDTLDKDLYGTITRRNGAMLERVLATAQAASEMPFARVKINNVVLRDMNLREAADFALLAKDSNLDVRFIEWMPFNKNEWTEKRFVSYKETLAGIEEALGVELEPQETDKTDTTKWFSANDFKGRVGFITSMSEHFCAGCSRLRITADGHLKVCLFGKDSISLRDLMRQGTSDDDIANAIYWALQGKKWAHDGHGSPQDIADAPTRAMILNGG